VCLNSLNDVMSFVNIHSMPPFASRKLFISISRININMISCYELFNEWKVSIPSCKCIQFRVILLIFIRGATSLTNQAFATTHKTSSNVLGYAASFYYFLVAFFVVVSKT